MVKINKLAIPATIIIASLILGGFFYASQISKQKSIEKQQKIKLLSIEKQQQIKIEQERQETEAKAEQDKRDYIAKRKTECYELFRDEQSRVSNVSNYGYVENYNLNKLCQLWN